MAQNVLYPVYLATNVSMATSFTSAAVKIEYQDNVGFQLDWTGTPVGTFSFQISSNHTQDYLGNSVNAGNWITLPVTPAITATGTANDAYVDLNQMSAFYTRFVYTATSGTGVLQGLVVAKGI
jgi:hypothetical protein